MASALDNALDAIAAGLIALAPPAPDLCRYTRCSTLGVPEGTSGHRVFRFEVPSGAETAAFGMAHTLVDHELRLVLRLSMAGVGADRLPGWVASHGVQLLNRINWLTTLGEGVRSIRAARYDVVQLADLDDDGNVIPSGDLDINVSLQVRAEESDG